MYHPLARSAKLVNMHQRLTIITSMSILFSLINAEVLYARPSSMEVNVREGCRRAVAGPYLSAFDQHEKAKQQLQVVAQQIKGIEKKLAEYESEMTKLRQDEKSSSFDLKLAAKKNRLLQTLGSYRQQLTTYRQLNETAQQNRKRFAAEKEELAKEISPVFIIKKLPTMEKNTGYPFVVAYKHECSQYRRLCPLPHEMAQALKTINIHGQTPKECSRYANFSNLR